VLVKDSKLQQMREVKVVIFLEKARNPIEGMVGLSDRLSDVRFFNGGIWQRSASRSPWK
jgi:hypothetical protein